MSYLAVSARPAPSDPDTMTTTAIEAEAIASPSAKNEQDGPTGDLEELAVSVARIKVMDGMFEDIQKVAA